MEQSDILIREKYKYINLLDQLRDARNKMTYGLNKLDEVSNQVVNGYSVDGISQDNGYLNGITNETRQIYTQLINVIIPNVENKISNYENSINDALIKEDIEKKAREKSDKND